MPFHYYTYYSKEKIKIANKEFASGGEGRLYQIASPRKLKNYIVKIYHKHKKLKEVVPKLKFMIEHKSVDLTGFMAYPKDLLLDENNNVIGFIMPKIKGDKLEVLCHPQKEERLSHVWKRYDLESKLGLEYRMRLGFSIACVLTKIHATENYTVVDFKPENLLVSKDTTIRMVDVDSMQIEEKGKLLYKAPVITLEYAPPEYHLEEEEKNQTFDKHWDNFSLAVILYRLFFQVHPYAASSNAPYSSIVNLHGKVEHGLFVHNENYQNHFNKIPKPHERFKLLPSNLQALFKRCFIEGHEEPSKRPSALEWAIEIMFCVHRYNSRDRMLEQLLVGDLPAIESCYLSIPPIVIKKNNITLLNDEYKSLLFSDLEGGRRRKKASFNNRNFKFQMDKWFIIFYFFVFLYQAYIMYAPTVLTNLTIIINNFSFLTFLLGLIYVFITTGFTIMIVGFMGLLIGQMSSRLMQTILSPILFNNDAVVQEIKKQEKEDKRIPIASFLEQRNEFNLGLKLNQEEQVSLFKKKERLYRELINLRAESNKKLDRLYRQAKIDLEFVREQDSQRLNQYLKTKNTKALYEEIKISTVQKNCQGIINVYQGKVDKIKQRFELLLREHTKEIKEIRKKLRNGNKTFDHLKNERIKLLAIKEEVKVDYEEVTLKNYIKNIWQD